MRKINDCFDKQLATISQQIIQLDQLNKTVNALLPNSLQNHCQVTQFHQGRLSISISDVTLATELRFFLPTLRDLLRQKAKIHQLASLHISIATPVTSSKKCANKITANLSQAAHIAINEASKICNYEPLQQAWQHMINKPSV